VKAVSEFPWDQFWGLMGYIAVPMLVIGLAGVFIAKALALVLDKEDDDVY
jgi:hypothetical protein